jgi:hypothetical protein
MSCPFDQLSRETTKAHRNFVITLSNRYLGSFKGGLIANYTAVRIREFFKCLLKP